MSANARVPHLHNERIARRPITRQALLDQVSRIKWFHQIDLGQGIVTPGPDKSARKLEALRIPEDLRGKSFLDIGAWDGFFSFAAERRGATRVLATDSFVWSGKTWGSKAGFNLARQVLESSVEDQQIDVMNLSPEVVGKFDVVLFAGVLYHLKSPLLALERVASVTKDLLILETEADLLWHRTPAMAFYPGKELRGDETNWCGPNVECVIAMLRCCGFSRFDVISKPSLARRIGRAVRSISLAELQRGRLIVHARK
jgi:tRNA (mo5U34)-methyltransferase